MPISERKSFKIDAMLFTNHFDLKKMISICHFCEENYYF
jgi:hypothetical protein